MPKSIQYEDKIREDLGLMFLTGVSTRCLSLISQRILGRRLSHTEVSKESQSLTEGVERWRSRDLLVNANLPFYKEILENEFTQKS